MLIGTYQRTLDAKMRFTLPAELRKELGDKVVLVTLRDALYGFTPEGFDAWVESQFDRDDKHYNSRDLNDVRLMRHKHVDEMIRRRFERKAEDA